MSDPTENLPSVLRASRQARKRTMRGFTVAVTASLVFHGAGVAWAVIAAKPRPAQKIESAIPVQLVKLGKKRDPKLLPRLVAEEPPAPPDAVKLDTGKKPNETPPKPKDKRETADGKLSDAAKRLLDNRLDRSLEKIAPEGDPEGDAHGTTTDVTNAASGYARDVLRVLQAGYRPPETIPASERPSLKTRVVLFIERNGKISRHEILEPHRNEAFMNAVENLLRSATLPPPPAALADQLAESGIEVVFHP
ncbi:MAG: TonB C-terminal domain-containing protein [Myxococcota bacterium]